MVSAVAHPLRGQFSGTAPEGAMQWIAPDGAVQLHSPSGAVQSTTLEVVLQSTSPEQCTYFLKKFFQLSYRLEACAKRLLKKVIKLLN